jgi:hypothetical protein
MAKVAIIGGVVFLCGVLALVGPSWAITLQCFSTDGIVALAWLLAAWGIGWPIVWRVLGRDQQHGALRIATAAACGLGVMSLLALGLGLAGILNYYTAWAIIGTGLALAVGKIWAHNAELEAWLSRPGGGAWAWVATMLPAAVVAAAALVPPGFLWGDEPNGYDVVEYHLQVPRQWYEAGRITPLKENVFSYFPQGVEMHYLLAMELRGGPWAGMYLAQFMHAVMFALAAVAVGGAAGIIVAATPWVALLAPVAYVEGGVLLYGSLAIIWANRTGRREAILAGAMAGLACGVKLTNVPMILLAIPVAWAVADRSDWLKRTLVFLAAGAAVFSPWLIRTAAWAGNPIFPQAMSLLGHAHFSAVQVERWRRAYLPTTGRFSGLWQQVLADWRFGYVLLPAALLAAAVRFRSPRCRFLLAMLLLMGGVWFFATHLQSRFLAPAIPVAALLIAEARWPKIALAALICVLLGWQLVPVVSHLSQFLELDRRQVDIGGFGILGRQNLEGIHGPDMLPENGTIDLVGDAEVFFYQIPMKRLGYRTVFDVDSSDGSKTLVEDWLGGSSAPRAGRRIVIDPGELERLSRTYFGLPKLTDRQIAELAGRPDVMMLGD